MPQTTARGRRELLAQHLPATQPVTHIHTHTHENQMKVIILSDQTTKQFHTATVLWANEINLSSLKFDVIPCG